MNSIWTDLLFLHGYLVRREDLAWRQDVAVENDADDKAKDEADSIRPKSPPLAHGTIQRPGLSAAH